MYPGTAVTLAVGMHITNNNSINHFGTSAKYLSILEQNDAKPSTQCSIPKFR